jgi:hypothetical protein
LEFEFESCSVLCCTRLLLYAHYHARSRSLAPRPMLPRMHPLCTTLLSGHTLIAACPNRLWHTAQCLSSSTTTRRFSPPGTLRPISSTFVFGPSSPSKTAASTATFSTPRSCAAIRSEFRTEFAFRMRPRKYDSRSRTGSEAGTRSSVDDAGSRAPCLLRSERAGGQLGACGGGGVR